MVVGPSKPGQMSRRRFLTYMLGASGAFMAMGGISPMLRMMIDPLLKKRSTADAFISTGKSESEIQDQPQLVQVAYVNKDAWYIDHNASLMVYLLRYAGQIHATYLVAQGVDGLYLLDQHAAHERIHYERLCAAVLEGARAVQPLLVPLSLTLSREEACILQTFLPLLAELGVEITFTGETSCAIHSHPAVWSEEEAVAILPRWLHEVCQTGRGETTEKRVWLTQWAGHWACRASVRANESLSHAEMAALLQQWAACQQPATCPHGRPVVVRITMEELAKWFHRGR